MDGGEGYELTVSAVGDCCINKRISVFREEDFLTAIEVIRSADIGLASCESLFHNYNAPAMPVTAVGMLIGADPSKAKEFQWAGFNMVSLSNSHCMDFGANGMFSTMEALDKVGVIHAGAGKDLDEASEPRYLETEKGRVALISSGADTFLSLWQKAANSRGGIVARPGMNMLLFDSYYVVDRDSFGHVKYIKEMLKIPEIEISTTESLDGKELIFGGNRFKQGDNFGVYHVPRKGDVERDLLSIREAKRSAHWVFVSFHSHIGGLKGLEYPPDFICQYAKACIDAGADAFHGHGSHFLSGIEIYKGKPIFYGLGNFIFHNLTVRVASEQYELFGLDDKARPADFTEARWGRIPPDEHPYAQWFFESVIAKFAFKQEKLTKIELYPVTLDYEEPRASMGRPKIAKNEQAMRIIENISNLSREFGTRIDYEEGIGVVKLSKN